MIWFACKQCGKCHGRAEQLAGTLVFCECGQGNRVPWSSTAAEPVREEAHSAPLPAVSQQPAAPSPPASGREKGWSPRAWQSCPSNSAFCLNHEETPKVTTCASCHDSFCSACVVTILGQTLCGPCKNFRINSLSRPPRLLPLAVVAFVFGLIGIVVSLILTLAAVGASMLAESGTIVAVVCCVIAVVFGAGELVLGWLALRQIERQPSLGGRALAMCGATAGLTGMVWASAIALFSIARQMQG